MRGYWIHTQRLGRYSGAKCGHYNPYIGYKSTPSRIDVRCRRCGARVQFQPNRDYERRGKHRQAIFIIKTKWTNEDIVEHCLVQNRILASESEEGFRRASELMKEKREPPMGGK